MRALPKGGAFYLTILSKYVIITKWMPHGTQFLNIYAIFPEKINSNQFFLRAHIFSNYY